MRVGADDRTTLEGRSVVHVHGDPLALVELAGVLSVEGDPVADRRGRRSAVVLRHGNRRLVLEVDEIVGAVEMLIKPLCRAFADHQLILGAAVGADSEILPVLDVPNLFNHVTQGRGTRPVHHSAQAGAGAAVEEEEAAPTVLIVDDSSTMRILERDGLQSGGYEVVLAEDGLKGIEALRNHPDIDLVVTDLNMPNCDGLEFTTRLRNDLMAQVPVMMVTTVDDAGTRRKAADAGVDHYLVKREFSQESFLAAVAELLGQPKVGGAM
jgi:CheY-like chemotaxis protein